ncbi:MAG: acyl-ACP--UDP-N-acetylglucosamine O-acyltransferase [Gammaproteobacteria bacterium]|nr:acyl-ACP--UDP-N-acetylglucosamine O-acyltransferase [Gammaproteobacteria bacterium]NNJ96540.1 acyl-ACP--UDP-N-acetylglucosamine O-acyltransferase [Gammaproteobacteria bacterium]
MRASSNIHPTAIVASGATLAEGVQVGPYAVIHDHVEIGANSTIGPHAVIHDYVRLGANNRVHAHAVLGDLPQDIGFDPATETWVEIGDGNTFREGVTIHRATSPERVTRLGSNAYMMAYTHIGHDCRVGDGVIITINTAVGGHVEIGDRAVLGGSVAVHQFCRIGQYAMVAGFIAVRKDVLPYTMVAGDPARHYRLNSVGLRRAGIKGERYRQLEQAYRALRAGDKPLSGIPASDEVVHLREWLAKDSKRGLSGFLRDPKSTGKIGGKGAESHL